MHPTTTDEVYALNLFNLQGAFVERDLSISGLMHDDTFSEQWSILGKFKPQRQTDRIFYLLMHGETKQQVLCRICTAYPGSDYDLFCRIHEICEPGDKTAVDTFIRWKEHL